jgi:hypothetical protein
MESWNLWQFLGSFDVQRLRIVKFGVFKVLLLKDFFKNSVFWALRYFFGVFMVKNWSHRVPQPEVTIEKSCQFNSTMKFLDQISNLNFDEGFYCQKVLSNLGSRNTTALFWNLKTFFPQNKSDGTIIIALVATHPS